MAEASFEAEASSDEGNHRLYAILNVPRDADESHIQRNFKQLSRVYHPDKSVAEKRDGAQLSFVAIKTAAEVLSDPVFRIAYDYGGTTAVMLVKRSQAAQHSHKAVAETRDEYNEDIDFVDLYSILEQAADDHEAALIIEQFVEEYRMQQQHMSKSQFDVSCEMPYVYRNSGGFDHPLFQRDSATVQVHSRHSLTSKVGASIGAGSELQHTGEANINASFGLDFQPVRGTQVTADAAVNHRTAPALSLRTSRQSATGTVMVAMIGGSTQSSKAWNASLISSKPILWESLFGAANRSEPTKLMATWRIAFNPSGQLRYVMAGLRTLEFPVWACRLCLGTYPVKISWRGADTDTFYATYSWGVLFSRVKLLRISSFGSSNWTFKYGLKYDGHALYAGGSLWSVLCHFQSSDFSLRIPIGLETVSPVAWLSSLLFAEFVDHQLEHFQSSNKWTREVVPQDQTYSARPSSRRDADAIRKVASKKRMYESLKEGGLVIREAVWQSGKIVCDVADILQFWVVDSQLQMPMDDSRLWWHMEQQRADDTEDSNLSWWDYLFGNDERQKAKSDTRSLTIRYQYNKSVYEIYLCGSDTIQIPNPNATELGPADIVI